MSLTILLFVKEKLEAVNRRKDRQHNDQKKKYKRTNNDLQNTTQKSKDRVTRTPVKTGDKLRCSRSVSSFCSTSGTHRDFCDAPCD
jgi:hypothetical protein